MWKDSLDQLFSGFAMIRPRGLDEGNGPRKRPPVALP
jgi:hypothetical protein